MRASEGPRRRVSAPGCNTRATAAQHTSQKEILREQEKTVLNLHRIPG